MSSNINDFANETKSLEQKIEKVIWLFERDIQLLKKENQDLKRMLLIVYEQSNENKKEIETLRRTYGTNNL